MKAMWRQVGILGGVLAAASCVAMASNGTAGTSQATDDIVITPSTPTDEDTNAARRLRWLVAAMNGELEFAYKPNFTNKFIRRVSRDQFTESMTRLREQTGGWTIETVRRATYDDITAVLVAAEAGAKWQVEMRIEAFEPHRIDGLRLQPLAPPMEETLKDWTAINDAVEQVPGIASIAVYEVELDGGSRQILGTNQHESLGIGMVSNIYLAGCLAEMLDDNETAWHAPIVVLNELKSVPPGPIYDKEDGKLVGPVELVQAMFADNDQSAADHLLHHIGRDRIEQWVRGTNSDPSSMLPFMTTREYAQLKVPTDGALLHQYATAADPDARRSLLETEVRDVIMKGVDLRLWVKPRRVSEVGWIASTDDVCLALARLYRTGGSYEMLALMDGSPTLPLDRITWPTVSWKASAEPGLLSMAMLLTRNDSRRFAVAFTVNDPDALVDPSTTYPIVLSTIELLADLP